MHVHTSRYLARSASSAACAAWRACSIVACRVRAASAVALSKSESWVRWMAYLGQQRHTSTGRVVGAARQEGDDVGALGRMDLCEDRTRTVSMHDSAMDSCASVSSSGVS